MQEMVRKLDQYYQRAAIFQRFPLPRLYNATQHGRLQCIGVEDRMDCFFLISATTTTTLLA